MLLANPQSAAKQMLATGFNDKRHMAARKALSSGNVDEAAAIALRVADSNTPWAMYVLAASEWFRGHRMRTVAYTTRGLRNPPSGPIDARYQALLRQVEGEFTAGVSVMLGLRPRPLLTACLIARDEQRAIERCIKSVFPIADEVVVLDTGSVDETREIAKGLGARVAEIEWPNDFAAARNAALDLATGDWILSIDADEWLDEISYVPVRACLADPSCFFVPLVRGAHGGQSFANTRLFPRRGARWKGRIHEDVEFDPPLMPVQLSAMILHHDGYTAEVREAKSKGDRNQRLIDDMKQEGGASEQVAEIFEALHAASFAETEDESIGRLKAVLTSGPHRSRLSRQVFMNLGSRLARAGRFAEAYEVADLAEAHDQHGLWSYYIKARVSYQNGDRATARKWASTGLAVRDDEGAVEQMRGDLMKIKDGTF